MPGYNDARTLIETKLNSDWSATQIAYENVEALDYSDPARPALSDGSSPYIQAKINFIESAVAAVGANAPVRAWGYLEVFFYSKTKTGTKANQVNVDAMISLFEYTQLNYVTFKETTMLNAFTEGGWYVTPIMIRFYFNR